MSVAEELREIGALSANLRIGWRDSLPRDVISGLRRIEALAAAAEFQVGRPIPKGRKS